ncbi:MAG: rod shape-determining protein MreC [Verrucomicrobiota bacterium]|jgi:rod shape-determining protein MreC
MLKKPHYIILVLVFLLVIVFLRLPGETMGRVKLAISGLFLPLFGLTGSLHELSGQGQESLMTKGQLARQNEELRRENQQLKLRLQQDEAIWSENTRLRGQVGWPRQTSWNVKLGRVIARDPANWWRSLQIDLGARDGIKPNEPVLTSEGLVGRIQNVGQTRSQVILLGNPDLRVAAAVQGSGETGVINSSSSSPQENNMIDLDYLSGNSAVRPGQAVVTSGEGGVFPANILIGKVVDSRSMEYGLSTEARVRLAADMDALQEVWVMTP